MLLIHVPQITNRLKFIFSFIFQDILKTEFALTEDKEYFITYQGSKFCYGKQAISGTLHFRAANILFEHEIIPQEIEFKRWNGQNVFFSVSGESALPFDVFGASFFLISRYDEYLPATKDKHGRFVSENSLNSKGDFLERPVINIWSDHLKLILSEKLNLKFASPAYTCAPTININNPYSYKYKGTRENSLALLKYLLKFQFKKFSKRFKVISGIMKDPFDSYDRQSEVHSKYKIKPKYFMLLGDNGKYDRNISHESRHYISLIQKLDKTGEACLHLSYGSAGNEEQIKEEKRRLESILKRPVTRSRQHFLKISIPFTYRTLIRVGIKEDYSMGYSSKPGFRAGTSTPFLFFDLEMNEQTELRIFPLIVMDTTIKHHLRIRSKDVAPFLEPIINEIKGVGGNFSFVFNNESIAGSGVWKNWGDVYEEVIRLAIEKK